VDRHGRARLAKGRNRGTVEPDGFLDRCAAGVVFTQELPRLVVADRLVQPAADPLRTGVGKIVDALAKM